MLLHFTPFGRGLYAIGYSKEAASFVGINVARSKFWLYVASGAVSALAGIYWTLRYTSARSDNASGLELAVIAAVLLGGVSIFGGKGSIPGVIAGVLLIGTLNYALRLARVSDVVLITVTGAAADRLGRGTEHRLRDQAVAPHPTRPPELHPHAPPEHLPRHQPLPGPDRTGCTDRTKEKGRTMMLNRKSTGRTGRLAGMVAIAAAAATTP